ncbi:MULTISPECIES: hypothetical protein [unclassified Desulfovibrio]|uniref:hypothetical protein n=1 Tax=unclassified Desulfovibrio TaxID=2593640 RepID=UPI0013EB5B5E|nr:MULTISPECIES: hypothetical protein [unclassified Desulfovibrio]
MSQKEIYSPIFSPADGEVLGIDITNQNKVSYVVNIINTWNYTDIGSAYKVYEQPSIIRYMFLKQVKSILRSGMGFSTLYDALEKTRGRGVREEQILKGNPIQAWSGLDSSKRLREFIRLHEKYLGGKVDEKKKWQWG